MHILRSPGSHLLVVAFACLLVPLVLADSDSKAQWAWVDESCNDKMDVLDKVVEEYLQLAQTAHDSLGDGITEVGGATLKTFFGKIDPSGLLIQSKYNTLQNIGRDGKKIPYSIYCDGSAFEWMDEDCEGNKIDGQWQATRSNPDQPELTIKDEKTNDICEDSKGNRGNAASQPNGNAIILCPLAFEKPATVPASRDEVLPPGTLLDNMVSISSILLHEMTHVALGTQDIKYDAIGCIFLALSSAIKARRNADTYELFALAMFLHKNNWSKMGAVQKPKATSTPQA